MFHGAFPKEHDQYTLEDCLAEICSRYHGIKEIMITPDHINPHEYRVCLKGFVGEEKVGQMFVINLRSLMHLPISDSRQEITEIVEWHIKEENIFTLKGVL